MYTFILEKILDQNDYNNKVMHEYNIFHISCNIKKNYSKQHHIICILYM